MISRALTGLGTLLWACLAVPGIAAAAEPARLGLTTVGQPGAYFELTLEPGARHASEVEAANFGTEAADARTYAADVYSIVNGGFGAELYGETPSAMTRWVSYPTQHLRLEAREAVRVPFVISVPVGTPPGEYVAALVIESTAPMQSSGPLTLSQVNRSAIAVAITVPGPKQPALAIGGVAHRVVAGHSILAFEVSNPGNVHLHPTGSFTLLNADGSPVHSAPVTMDAVYAWTGTRLEAPLAEPLPRGDYCAELSLTDAATGAHDETDCLAFSVPAATEADRPEEDGVRLPDMLPGTNAVARAAPGILLGIGGTLVTVAVMVAARRRRRGQRTVTSMSETHR
jgi:hypothetical protein